MHREVGVLPISTDLRVRQDAPDGHSPLARSRLAQLVVAHHHCPRQLVAVPGGVGAASYRGDGISPCPPLQGHHPRTAVTAPYPPKQCAAVRTQERPTSTPPHISSPCSRTDTSQGQAPRGATLPPMIRPRGTVALACGTPRRPQLPGGQRRDEEGVLQAGCWTRRLPGGLVWPGMAVAGGGGGGR